MNAYRTLIDAGQLAALQGAGTPTVVLDCRFELSNPSAGEAAYLEGHLPLAHYAHLDRDLSGPKSGRNGRHPLPDRQALAITLGRWGIGPRTQVVAYDAHGGPYAARAWWLLRWMGHEAVAVLDGGLGAWQQAGGAWHAGPMVAVAGPAYPAQPAAMATIDADALLAQLGRVRVLDARAGERFRGEVETLDPVAGHIPGATLRCFMDNLGADGRFKPAETLRDEYAALATPAGQIVHQCGSGVTACHNLLAMAHIGMEGSCLYPGSWSEWCADPSRPVAVG